jgi:YHS domain-containing protein
MSINHVLTNNNNKTNWMTANNLENVVYKISGNGKEYVFSNPNSFAKFLNKNKNSLNAYLNGLNRNANITVRIGNHGVRPVRGPFGPIKPRQVQKVRLVGERQASAPVNLKNLMAKMRFNKQAPNIASQNTTANETRNRRTMINAVINKLKLGLRNKDINVYSNAGKLRTYLRERGVAPSFAINNENLLNLRNVVNTDPNVNAAWWETNGQATRALRNAQRRRLIMIRRVQQARGAVSPNVSSRARGLLGQSLFNNANNQPRVNWRTRSNTALATPNSTSSNFTSLLNNWNLRYRFGASNADRQLANRLHAARMASWRARAEDVIQRALFEGNIQNNAARSLAAEIANTNFPLENRDLNMAAALALIR